MTGVQTCALPISPALIGGHFAPAQGRGVHHVIMQQGSGVDQLNNGGDIYVLISPVAEMLRNQQDEDGAQAFAATVDYILTELINERYVGVQGILDALVHIAHIPGH